MTPFNRLISRSTPITDATCDALLERIAMDDERSETITVGHAFYGQFLAHMTVNSKEVGGTFVNLYNGLDDGQGIYPELPGHAFLNNDNRFVLPVIAGKENLRVAPKKPDSDMSDPGQVKHLAIDMNRSTENPVLAAHHLLAEKLHNKRMDAHGDFDRAKAEVVACFNHATLDYAKAMTGYEEAEIFDVAVKGVNTSAEFNFAAFRIGHPQMPATVGSRRLFDPAWPADIDLAAMYDGSEMARTLNPGRSGPMADMAPVPERKDIFKRNFDAQVKQGLASWEDVVALYKRKRVLADPLSVSGCPIFFGIALEAQEQGEGRLGPIGARLFADAIAGMLLWAGPGEGIYHPRWEGAPNTMAEIIDYAW